MQWWTTGANRIDWQTDDIRTALTAVGYVPLSGQDTDDFFNDVTNELAATGGYVAGGTQLTGRLLSYQSASNEVQLDANDAVWSSASFTARNAVTYKSVTGSPSTSPLMGFVDFGGNETVTSGTFQIQWDSTGVLKITAL